MTSPPSPQPRLPGGQPGNTNALKHGFYARKFTPENLDDYERARLVTGLDEEIALLRLVILNIVQACLPAPGDSPDLAACHALEAALGRLSHLLKDQHFLALGTTDPAGIIAALFAEANANLPVTKIFQPAPATTVAPSTSSPLPPLPSPLVDTPSTEVPPSSPLEQDTATDVLSITFFNQGAGAEILPPSPIDVTPPSMPVGSSAPPSTGASPTVSAYPPSFPPSIPLLTLSGAPLTPIPFILHPPSSPLPYPICANLRGMVEEGRRVQARL